MKLGDTDHFYSPGIPYGDVQELVREILLNVAAVEEFSPDKLRT